MKIHLCCAALAACSVAQANTQVAERKYDFLPACASPAATLVVGEVSCKAAACQPRKEDALASRLSTLMKLAGEAVPPDLAGIGGGLGNALTTALKATGCFEVQEREAMEALRREMELAGLKMEAKPADYMVLGAITALDAKASKASFGGGYIPLVGAISKKKTRVDMSTDVRIVDVRRASVAHSRTFVANSETSSWGTMGGALAAGNAAALFGSYSNSKDPALDSVANETLMRAVTFLVDTLAASHVTYRPPEPAATPSESKPAAPANEDDAADTGAGFSFGGE